MDYFVYALNLFVVVSVLCGIMLFIHDKVRINPAFLPILTVSLSTLITYTGGLLGALSYFAITVYILGITAWVYEIVRIVRRKYSPKEFLLSPGIWAFALFSLYFIIRMRGMLVLHVDNFSHWATIIKEMCLTDSFPIESTAVIFRNYAPGSAMFVYFVCKAVTFTEGHALMAQGIAISSALAVIFCKVRFRNVVALVSLTAVSILTVSIPELLSSSLNIYNFLVDGLMAYIIAAGGIIVYFYRRNVNKCMLTLVPVIGMLTIIKNSARIFAALITVYAVIVFVKEIFHKKNYQALSGIVFLIVVQVLFPMLYNWYSARVFPEHTDKFSSDIGGLLSSFTQKDPMYLRQILSKMMTQLTDFSSVSVRVIVAAEIVAVAVLAIMLILRKPHRLILRALICANLTGIFYIAELFILYGFIFEESEANNLASFYRYFATAATLITLVLFVAAIYQLKGAAIDYDSKKIVPALLSTLMLASSILPLYTAKDNVIQLIRPYYRKETAARLEEREYFHEFFSYVSEIVPANSYVLVYTENKNFFESSLPMYELLTYHYVMIRPANFADTEKAKEMFEIRQYITVDGDHTKFKENMRSLGYSVIGEDSAVYKISADTMTLTAVIES